MIPSVKTTHARPAHLPPARIVVEASVLVCPHCMHAIGSFKNYRERSTLELKHICPEKLVSRAPSVGVPYS